MPTRNSYITVAILTFNLIWSVVSLVEFSRDFENVYKLGSEQGVTMAACEAGCERRRFCKSAIYHRRAAYCVYTAMDRSREHVVTRIGTVLISGFHPGVQWESIEMCGTQACGPTETCTTDTVGAQTCTATECRIPPQFRPMFMGNLNSIGSKAIYACTGTQVECGTDGRWSPLTFHDCSDVCERSSGVFPTKVWIYPMFQKSVYCDMDTDGGHWLVFQRRVNGSVNFYRNWTEYRNGFGHPAGEFWLGLEYLHQIVSGGQYELRIDMEDWSGIKKFAKYSSFSINGETDKYRLTVSGYSGDDSGDSLLYHSGSMFTTYDNDNDASSYGNCAQFRKGAWWYNACHKSNLNAIYEEGGYTAANDDRIHWSSWHGMDYSLRRTEMKIRRK